MTCFNGSVLFIINIALNLALHLVELGVKSDKHPSIIEGLFLSVDTTMDHHLVMAKSMGYVCLSWRWLLS